MTTDKYHWINITTNTTTDIFRGRGVLHSITINTKGAATNAIIVYHGTVAAGIKVATIDSTSLQGTFFYDAYLTGGLTIVTSSGTPGDITVCFIV